MSLAQVHTRLARTGRLTNRTHPAKSDIFGRYPERRRCGRARISWAKPLDTKGVRVCTTSAIALAVRLRRVPVEPATLWIQ